MRWTIAKLVGPRHGPRFAMLGTGISGFVLGAVLGTRSGQLLPVLQAIAVPVAAVYAAPTLLFVLSMIVMFVVDFAEARHSRNESPQGDGGLGARTVATVAGPLRELLEEIAVGRAAVRRFEQLYANVMFEPPQRVRPTRPLPISVVGVPSITLRKVESKGTAGRLKIVEVHR